MEKREILIEKLKGVPRHLWVLLAIIILGIFLRTYHFHAWLNFENDQVRDAFLVSDVLTGKTAWPLLGPTMRGSWDAQANLFHLGPIYYYFQIISGYIFGNYPDKLAYPDLLFSILAIPLFYIFLRKYFRKSLSLALTGLFSISFFAITYARFAWNPNSIPFFTLLFLLALYEFLTNKEKTSWVWSIFLGSAIGVGIQLHVITFLLFGATSFFVAAYLLKNNWRIWKKIALVFLVVLIFNFSQIRSEIDSGFFNSKVFLSSVNGGDVVSKDGPTIMEKVGFNLNCHAEANAYILSSIGSNGCIFSYRTVLRKITHDKKTKKAWKEISQPEVATDLILGFIFSIFGYCSLAWRAWKEKDEKQKIFLRLIILYVGLSFLVMLPIADKFTEFRYFIQVFFVPFLFLGFLADLLISKSIRRYTVPVAVIIFMILAFLNANSIFLSAKKLYNKAESDVHYAILGEMESMVEYVTANSSGQSDIYLVGDATHVSHFIQPFSYLAEKIGVNLIKVNDKSGLVPPGKPIFYITDKVRKGDMSIAGYNIEGHKIFGQVVIYKLKN